VERDYFDASDLAALSQALDAALAALRDDGEAVEEPGVRSLAASAIIRLAQTGETCPETLREAGVRAIRGAPALRLVAGGRG
jgi:hypothetical protein